MRSFGSGRSWPRSLKNCVASVWFHSTADPTLVLRPGFATGTVVVTGLRSANATEISWVRPVPWSIVIAEAAPLAAGMTANGLASVPLDVILFRMPLIRIRWSCSRWRSPMAKLRVRTKPSAWSPLSVWHPALRFSPALRANHWNIA